jgi:repressor LexA
VFLIYDFLDFSTINFSIDEGVIIMKLSDRQVRILEFIADFLRDNNFPPTIREIGKAVGITSTSVVKYNLTKLEKEELIIRHKEVSRGLSLNWPRLAELGLLTDRQGPETYATLDLNGVNEPDRVRPEFEFVNIPVLGHIAAGEPIQVEPQHIQNADEWIELTKGLFPNPTNLFALRVQGDSMIDASVLDGDIVILRYQETAENGDMVAAWIEGDEETTLKYFRPQGETVVLQPANPAYKPIVRPAEKIRINGKVVSVIRQLE